MHTNLKQSTHGALQKCYFFRCFLVMIYNADNQMFIYRFVFFLENIFQKKSREKFGVYEICCTFALANEKQRHSQAKAWRDSSDG